MKDKNSETSSGNIFLDLGVANPEERLAKVKLAIQINLLIKEKGVTQKDAAELLGVDQAKISALHQGKLAGFSIERLFRFLNILGQDISINIVPKARTKKQSNIEVIYGGVKKRKPAGVGGGAVARNSLSARKNKRDA